MPSYIYRLVEGEPKKNSLLNLQEGRGWRWWGGITEIKGD